MQVRHGSILPPYAMKIRIDLEIPEELLTQELYREKMTREQFAASVKEAGFAGLRAEDICPGATATIEVVEELPEENAALKKDKERLDWLEQEVKKSYTGISFDYVRLVEEGHVAEKGYRFMRHHFLGPRVANIREAIDAARKI